MRFICHQKVHSLYLILILLNYGTTSQCSLVERGSKSSSSTSSTHSYTGSGTTHSHSSTSSTHSLTTSHSHSRSFDTSVAVESKVETVESISATTPAAKSTSFNEQQTQSSVVGKGPKSKTVQEIQGNTTDDPEGNSPKVSAISSSDGPHAKARPSSSSSSSDRPDNDADGWPHHQSKSPTTTTPSTTFITDQVTLTSSPNWKPQKIPLNTCTTLINHELQWVPCMVTAGTVDLSYFPEPSGNLTYPSTYYDSALGMTLTSPSIYMIINTMWATNPCGLLGPTYTNFVVAMDLTEVITFQPYPDSTARDRIGEPRVLTLADLDGCGSQKNRLKRVDRPRDIGEQTVVTHAVVGDWARCHPVISQPPIMKSQGLPYWRHCGNGNGEYGIFDPPGAVPPVAGIFPTTSPTPFVQTSVTANPASSVQPVPTPTSSASAEPQPQPSEDLQQSANTVLLPPSETQSANSPPEPTTSNLPSPAQPSIPTPGEPQPNFPDNDSTAPPATPTPVATIGSNTINVAPGSTGFVLPNGSLATIGSVTTLTDSNNNPIAVSIASSGIIIQGSGTHSFIPNPTSSPPPATPLGSLTPIATLGSLTISARPGASTLVIADQTLTKGGPPVTISNTHNVATLAPDALIIQFPSGVASIFALPTSSPATPTAISVPALNNLPITPLPGGSAVQIGTQTLSIGGPVATIQETTVVTLAPVGLIIQQPGGVESTVSIPGISPASPLTSSISNANGGIGGIIASMEGIAPVSSSSVAGDGIASVVASGAGVAPWTVITIWPPTITATPTPTETNTSGTAEPAAVFTGAGRRMSNSVSWEWWVCMLIFSGLVVT